MTTLLDQAKQGFATLKVNPTYQHQALAFLEQWLSDDQFADFVPQIEHLIQAKHWDYLLDSFYQVIPFGTGGRRGEVGIGPNRINQWTIQASAQGHSQYLLQHYGDQAKERGVVFAYDVRQFTGNAYFNPNLPNPVLNLDSQGLARVAAEVYAANGIKVYTFDGVRTTPELSFAIRHLQAVAGDVFSASHNPPSHNGKKVYDEFGGQLIPPADEALVKEVTQQVSLIHSLPYDQAVEQGLIITIDQQVDQAYIQAATTVSLSSARDIKIVYTPMHGCGSTSVSKALTSLGFIVDSDPQTSNPSGRFENVTFNIPNPEVIQSFDTTLAYAKQKQADIILNSDPDADRIGIMVHHQGQWQFVNGNEIAAILTAYVIDKKKANFTGQETAIKTIVTTDLVERICQHYQVKLIGDLLIGFKYVGDIMNHIEQACHIDQFLVGIEESHGYIAGNYARDKDAVTAAIWLSELAAELKRQGQTLIDYLNQIYASYGYFRNYLTEIRMLGATGKERIDAIQEALRTSPPQAFGRFSVTSFEDGRNRLPIVSETDRAAKDVLIFKLDSGLEDQSMKVTVRPSGTEPKIKMYFEVGAPASNLDQLSTTQEQTEKLLQELEKAVMLYCYQTIGIDFPERGFLLFWQLPLDDKLKYFDIEPQIEALNQINDQKQRQQQLNQLLAFLGSNPIQKIDPAFQAKYGQPLRDYLQISD